MSEKEKLNYFISVAKLGSVKSASQFYNIKPAHIFRKIHSIEIEYGIKLFLRNYRGLDLTPEGEKFFRTAQKIISEIEKFEDEIAPKKTLKSINHLTIASTYAIASYWIAPNLPKFLAQYPHTSIKLQTYKCDVDMDTVDIGIGPKILGRDDLIQKRIKTYTFKLYASKEYLKSYGTPNSLKCLDNHRLIFYSGDDRLSFHEVESLFQLENTGNIRLPIITVNSASAELQIVKQGGGIACIATDWPEIHNNELIDLFPNIQKSVHIYGIYRKNNYNPIIKSFLDTLLLEEKV